MSRRSGPSTQRLLALPLLLALAAYAFPGCASAPPAGGSTAYEGAPPGMEADEGVFLSVQSADEFEGLRQSAAMPLVVYFYSSHCPGCTFMTPAMRGIASGNLGRAYCIRLQTGELIEIWDRYQVYGTPNVLVFANGKVIRRMAGFHLSFQVQSAINEAIRLQKPRQ